MQGSSNFEANILSIVPKDTPVDFVLEKASAQKLISLGETEKNDELARLAQVIGDCARAEENRGTLGEAGALELLGKLLETKSVDLQIAKFAARAIGNLCYEHPENRTKASKAQVVPRVVALLASADLDAQRNASGCLANLASATEELQQEISRAGGAAALVKVFGASNSPAGVRAMALRAICNLAEKEEQAKAVVDAGVLGLLSTAALAPAPQGVDDFPTSTASLLTSLSEFDSVRGAFASQGVTKQLIEAYEKLKDEELRSDVLKCLAFLSLDDANVSVLFPSLPLCLSILKTAESEDTISAAMLLGNLARKDDHCLAIAGLGGVRELLNLVRRHGDNVKVLHLALGALRNLCIAGNNREKALEANAVEVLSPLLAHKNGHAIYAAVGVLKVLVGGAEKYAQALVNDPQALPNLVKVCTPSETIVMDGSERIVMEAARIVAMVLSHGGDLRARVVAGGGCVPLVRLATSQYTVLQFEGARALLKVAESEDLRDAVVKAEALGPLVELAGQQSTEAAVAAVLALEKLTETDHIRVSLKKDEQLFSRLTAIASSANNAPNTQKLHEIVTKLLARLNK